MRENVEIGRRYRSMVGKKSEKERSQVGRKSEDRKIATSNFGERALRYPLDLMTRKLSGSVGESQ